MATCEGVGCAVVSRRERKGGPIMAQGANRRAHPAQSKEAPAQRAR